MNNMAPPHDDNGSSELFNGSAIRLDEYNIMDFFETDELEQLHKTPDVRESGSKSPSSLGSTAVTSNTSHGSDFPITELDHGSSFPLLLHAIVL